MSKKAYFRLDSRGIRLPDNECPTCHIKFNSSVQVNGEAVRPGPNDITICMSCGEVLVFDSDMEVHIITLDELATTHPDSWEEVDKAVKEIKTRRN